MADINLVINLNKPKGLTSQQAVIRTKRLFSAKKAGHTGTLDPIATGVLIVCINEATKITRFLAEVDKEYIAQMKLGERTDTLDSEGKIIYRSENFLLDKNRIKSVLQKFRGNISQVPPMYSAIKISGRPLYKFARKGIEIERPHKSITIYELDMLRFDPPFLEIRVSCSKGTYIRTLCDDIGTALGVGAHMVALKRVRVGDFRIEDSAEIEELPGKEQSLYTIDMALKYLKDIVLTSQDFIRATKGMVIISDVSSEFPINSYLRLKDPATKLFAIGKVIGSGMKVERLLNL